MFREIYWWLYIGLMPFHHWMISFPVAKYVKEVRETQWLDLEQMTELQNKKLKSMINHAYSNVPYYKKLFTQEGIEPSDIKDIHDLDKLPILTKDDIRENLSTGLVSTTHDPKRMQKTTTSGSTGEPLIFYADKYQLEMRWATTLRNIEWTGYRFGDKQVRLWHSTIGMSQIHSVQERFDAFMCRRHFLPVFDLDEKKLGAHLTYLSKYKPALVDGYAEAFNLIARYARKHHITGIRPKGIISSAQTLSRHSRETIEDTFKCKMFDKYGAREFSGIAHECEAHEGHHVNAESYIVEILKNGKQARPGETGEVVITDLNNYCMPFIRYKLGDIATASHPECSCGRGLPLIGEIQGRVQSIIIGTHNQYLPSAFFLHYLKDYGDQIKQFQIIQTEFGKLTLKIIKGEHYSKEAMAGFIKVFKDRLGEDMEIDVQFVNEIPMTRTGKHRQCISKIWMDYIK